MFQAGYLTVESVDNSSGADRYYLRFPNAEIEASLFKLAFRLSGDDALKFAKESREKGGGALAALASRDAPAFQKIFSSLLASIPSKLRKPNGSAYQAIFLTTLGAAGGRFNSEEPSGDGIRGVVLSLPDGADLVIETRYVAGLKKKKSPNSEESETAKLFSEELAERMEKAARKALAQIEEKEYAMRFKGRGNKICKCALVIGNSSDVLIVFEEAENWKPIPAGDWDCVIEDA
jgi:hypothetical protein